MLPSEQTTHHPAFTRNRFPPSPPEIDDEYFEWIALLEAAQSARKQFTFVELGSGKGRWSARAIKAAEAAGMTGRAILVEAEPGHADDTAEFMASEGIDPSCYHLIRAAVAAQRGTMPFVVEGPHGFTKDNWLGQALLSCASMDRSHFAPAYKWRIFPERYYGKQIYRDAQRWGFIEVDVLQLADVLPDDGTIDLIDMDIQGAEGELIHANIELLTKRVKRVCIATHSTGVEETIRRDLAAAGWDMVFDYPLQTETMTDYGLIAFRDGVQYWVNGRI
ncbi:FkbM family methyltransferase [Hyphomicrobium sp.]|jgi:FkbM family methyltransferase|uniref:FkbM family methyltransferase n=1 Tax=Hyphomicrobium sp. TaxID=82 RepID=UPI002FE2B17E